MTEREIEVLPDAESGKTLRIVEVSGRFPGFRVQSLENGILPGHTYWNQISFEDSLEAAREEVRLIHLAAVELKSLTREYIRFGNNPPHTPDGAADYGYKYADGVIKLSTPGHGYLHLDEERNQQVHEAWRATDGFYEEDCAWAAVAHHFPELFTTHARRDAQRILINWMPHQYMKVTGEQLAVSDSFRLQEEAFIEATKDKWVSVAAERHSDGMLKVTAALGGNRRFRPGQPRDRVFLVPSEEYERRSKFGLILDPDRHQEIQPDRRVLSAA